MLLIYALSYNLCLIAGSAGERGYYVVGPLICS